MRLPVPVTGPGLLLDYGFTPAIARHFTAHDGTAPARVVRVDRNRVLAATATRIESLPPPKDTVVTGDWVRVARDPGGPRAVALLPRTSLLRRKDAYRAAGGEHLLAANVDVVAVVVPLDRPLSGNRLERTLVAARDSGARPLVVVTKADLAGLADDVVALLARGTGGAAVVTTAAATGDGIDELALHIPPGTCMALLGPSGAGKSSLVNALVGRQAHSTGGVRLADGRGRHTTTARELLPVPGGGVVLDTPGVRGLALWDAGAGLGEAFADVAELAAGCRFADCAHGAEPGCAVRAAIAEGTLEERRWASYATMRRELEASDRRRPGRSR